MDQTSYGLRGETATVVMELYGMISEEDQADGFVLVLDDDYYVMLVHKGQVRKSFDPRDYTAPELRNEVDAAICALRAGDSPASGEQNPGPAA